MHPELFTLPIGAEGLVVGAYGFLVGLGLVVGWIWALRHAALDRLPADRLGSAYVLGAALSVFGARALWIVQHGADAAEFGGWLALRSGQFASGAGILIAVFVSLAICARYGVPFLAWADAAAPAAIGALAFERVGAFLSGTNFGVYVDPTFPLAVRFPADSPVYQYQRATMTGMHFDPGSSLPVHPVQLYGLAGLTVVLVALLWLRAHRSFSGQMAMLALVGYAAVRMVVEDSFRVEHSPEVLGPVRLGLLAFLALAALASAVYLARSRQATAAADGLAYWRGGPWEDLAEPASRPEGREPKRARRTEGLGGKGKRKKTRK